MALEFLSPLHKASRQLSIHLEAQLAEVGVSPTEGHILSYLRGYTRAPIGELVRVFGIKQSTLTSILDRLEANRLIRREVNPGDRRSFVIGLTDEGRELADAVNVLLLDLEERIRGRLRPGEINGFRATMRAVEEVTQVRVR